MANSVGDGANAVFGSVQNWLAQPFNPNMDTTHWFLFAGLVLCILAIWAMVLRDIKGAIE